MTIKVSYLPLTNFLKVFSNFQSLPPFLAQPNPNLFRCLTYVQGQTNEKRREYFYYIDHQGQLFLDDARIKNFTSCFKEKDFLEFFFKQLCLNETGNYEQEFPYLSPCGRERNYIRCDDVPVVFTHFLPRGDLDSLHFLSWGGAGDRMTVDFDPSKICMLPSTGRVYHPAPVFPSRPLGLIKSSLAIEMSKDFEFEGGEDLPPTHFNWIGVRYKLTNELIEIAQQFSQESEDF